MQFARKLTADFQPIGSGFLPLQAVQFPSAAANMGRATFGGKRHHRPVLIGALLFDTALAVLSVWLFREPRWWYPSAVTFPLAGAFLLAELGIYNEFAYG